MIDILQKERKNMLVMNEQRIHAESRGFSE
jgi:hypothetical protein